MAYKITYTRVVANIPYMEFDLGGPDRVLMIFFDFANHNMVPIILEGI